MTSTEVSFCQNIGCLCSCRRTWQISVSCPEQLHKFSKFSTGSLSCASAPPRLTLLVVWALWTEDQILHSVVEDALQWLVAANVVVSNCLCLPSTVNEPINRDESDSSRNRLNRLKCIMTALERLALLMISVNMTADEFRDVTIFRLRKMRKRHFLGFEL